MAVVHFTVHAYGSWLPDRDEGFVERRTGWRPPNLPLAAAQRRAMIMHEARFTEDIQLTMIDELQVAAFCQRLRLRLIACELTHFHLCASWQDVRDIVSVLARIKASLTARLNREHGRRRWFVKGGRRRNVTSEEHYFYLKNVYFPAHSGWKWDEERGLYK